MNVLLRGEPQRIGEMEPRYRPEIDGLRAIAVIAVVFYHAEIVLFGHRLMPGGFLGVDVFFVISGYLIGSQVLSDVRRSEFSFLRFYERRARRLLPALYLVLLLTLVAAWFFAFSEPMMNIAQGVIATVTFWSNVFFWEQGGYTADANAIQPLIHTWSLSVEEQFYLLFPIASSLLWRWTPRLLAVVFLATSALSLVLAEVASGYFAAASFYLMPTRVWELFAGVLLANLELNNGGRRKTSTLFASLGIVAIGLSVLLIDDRARHPGIVTLIPVLGTALVIWFAAPTGRLALLASRPAVLIGLASYSIYLWHQPIFAFARMASINALSDLYMLWLIGLSCAAGILTWLLVERPTRSRRSFSTTAVWRLSAFGAVALCAVSAVLLAGNGFPERFPRVLESGEPVPEWTTLSQDGAQCHRNDVASGCHFKLNNTGQDWVLVGDSHASVLARQLLENLRPTAKSFHTFTWGGCPVIFDVDYVGPPPQGTMGCHSSNEERRRLLRQMPPSTIVYVARMGAWIEGTRFDNGEGGVEPGYMDLLQPTLPWAGKREDALAARVTATIEELLAMGHRVVLIYPVPEVGWHVPQTVRKLGIGPNSAEWFAAGGLTTSLLRYFARNQRAFAAYDAVPDNPALSRVYPHEILCSEATGRCRTHDERVFFYSDDDHLSAEGVSLIMGTILQSAVPSLN